MLRPRLVKLGAALAAGGLFAGSTAINAQNISIHYHPYELATQAGAAAVLARIERVTERACRPQRDQLASPRPCRNELTSQIVAKIDHPMVTALWRTSQPGIQLASRSR